VAGAYSPWHVGIAGRAALRAGKYEQAEALCREAIQLGAGSPNGVHRVNYPTLALALHRQGKIREAEQALGRAEQARDQWIEYMLDRLIGTMPFSWWDWLEFNVMYREAKTRIADSPPPEDARLAALYERGRAAIISGDAFAFMDAGREQVNRQAWDAAAANFVKVLDQLPLEFRSSTREMRFCIEMVQHPEVFDRLVELRPSDRRLWYARGQVHASRRQWTEAIADFSKSLEIVNQELQSGAAHEQGPQMARAVILHYLAAVKLLAGDQAGYRDLCATIVKEHARADSAIEASCLSRACTLTPDALADWSMPLDLARQAVDEQPRAAWHLYALGIAQLRAGQHQEAVQTLKRSLDVRPNWVGRSQNHVVLALACHRLGRVDQARQWLQEARWSLNEADRTLATSKFGFAASDYLSDWLCTHVLLAEAEKHLANDNTPSGK
jgi:tetratricopeptide (TPR) repeat protein